MRNKENKQKKACLTKLMEQLETRLLKTFGFDIITGVEGESVGVLIHGSDQADFIHVQYNWELQALVINPSAECVKLDSSINQVLIFAGDGDDDIRVRGGNGTIQYTVYGEGGNDTITGSNGPDWLDGGDGNDFISGALGADYLIGGDGQDSLFGGSGGDFLEGGNGVDELWGGRGRDTLDWELQDAVILGEELVAGDATPPQEIDPNEIVTP